jgi:DNA-binding FadR family transcriptional regulator
VPGPWVELLVSARHISTYRVALYLLHRNWKEGGRSSPLANGVVEEYGVSRRQKWEALRELERLGLVQVERRPRKSPLVTVIMSPKLP